MSEIRDAARERRLQTIALLTACDCDYPLKVYVSMSGHPSTCPADRLWREANLPGKVTR